MSESSWQFRTTEGVVTVRDDAIAVSAAPSRFLAGQVARWRHGGTDERLKVAFRAVAFVLSLFSIHQGVEVAESGLAGLTPWSLLYVAGSVLLVGTLLHRHFRETTIPRDALRSVTLDEDGRELTVTHDAPDGPLSAFRGEETETSFTLPSDDDLREAREILRLRSVEVETVEERETVTEHRLVTRDGATFCENCDAHVSPNDRHCRRCGAALHVEREVEVA